MRFRLVELLQCVRCNSPLDVTRTETRPRRTGSKETFSCRTYCGWNHTVEIPAASQCIECGGLDIVSGVLTCRSCRHEYRIVDSVPWLFDETAGRDDRLSGTIALYSHLWTDLPSRPPDGSSHVEQVEETLGESVVRGRIGLDAGSGSGIDTQVMAARHPDVELVSLDISAGVNETRRRTEMLPNVHVLRASVLSIPLKNGSCDFAYSFGVLHHTSDPKRGLAEIARTLKPGGTTALYLYEDHADNAWKAVPLKLVNGIRRITTGMNTRLLSGLCWLLSPLVFVTFTVPARIMGWFRRTRPVTEKMPFNFGTSPFSLHGDLVDRFGAPIEVRYSRDEVVALLASCNLVDIGITKFKMAAGWVARGMKPGA